jgi:hypothetical protein
MKCSGKHSRRLCPQLLIERYKIIVGLAQIPRAVSDLAAATQLSAVGKMAKQVAPLPDMRTA